MRTDYAAHESAYQRLRQSGRPGWDQSHEATRALAILDSMLAWPGVPAPGRLIELGAGAGDACLHLARCGWRTHGVEISPTAVDWAREKAAAEGSTATFHVGNVLDLCELVAGETDVVLDGHCLHCIIGTDRARFLATAMRLLRPGGVLCVRTMCGDVPAGWASQGWDPESRCIVRNGVASRYVGKPSSIAQEISAAGFGILRQEIVPRLGDDNDLDELLLLAQRPQAGGKAMR